MPKPGSFPSRAGLRPPDRIFPAAVMRCSHSVPRSGGCCGGCCAPSGSGNARIPDMFVRKRSADADLFFVRHPGPERGRGGFARILSVPAGRPAVGRPELPAYENRTSAFRCRGPLRRHLSGDRLHGHLLTAADGAYVQARTIEWAQGLLRSDYVVVPRGERLRSFTPTGADGLSFAARYGVVGLTVAQPEFIAEGSTRRGSPPDSSSFLATAAMRITTPRRMPACAGRPAGGRVDAGAVRHDRRGARGDRHGAHHRDVSGVGAPLAHRRTFGPAGGAGDRRRRAAFLRERGGCAH